MSAFVDNVASLRVLEKAGLTRVGTSVDDGRPLFLFTGATNQQGSPPVRP